MVSMQCQRSLYLVDAENMVGSVAPFASEIADAWKQVQMLTGYREGDLVVVGSSNADTLVNAYHGIPGARNVCVHGKDGADYALLDVMNTELAKANVDRVVLVSGDGIFAQNLATAASSGFRTHVCSRVEQLSTRLRLAAQEVTFLSPAQYVTHTARIAWSITGKPRLVAA